MPSKKTRTMERTFTLPKHLAHLFYHLVHMVLDLESGREVRAHKCFVSVSEPCWSSFIPNRSSTPVLMIAIE